MEKINTIIRKKKKLVEALIHNLFQDKEFIKLEKERGSLILQIMKKHYEKSNKLTNQNA